MFRSLGRLTPEEKARWGRRLRDPLTIAFAIVVLVLASLTTLWGMAVYRLEREVSLLRIEYNASLKDRAGKDASIRAEFDTVYQTLYNPPSGGGRKQTYVELWQANRDRELRDRIRQLEIRVGRLER